MRCVSNQPTPWAVVLCLVLVVGGCDGGDGDEGTASPTAVPQQTATAASESTQGVPTTGVEELDAVMDAVESNDLAYLRDRIQLETLACGAPAGPGGPPQCQQNEAEGTLVDVFKFRVCEPEWLREPEIEKTLTEAFAYTFKRFAAFEEEGRYVAIFEVEEMPTVGAAVAVVLEDQRIVEIWRICGAGEGGDGLIPSGQTDFLLDPQR